MSVEWPIPTVLVGSYVNFIIGIISFFTTTLAIIAYFYSFTIRHAYQNVLLLNLLINAILFSLESITFNGYAVVMGHSNILSIGWVCSLNGFVGLFCAAMEIYTLLCIALERYFAIKKQQPLTFHQIIALLVFGWVECGLLASVPLWNYNAYYTLSDAKFYCTYPWADRSQLGVSISSAVHVTICLSVINYCYLEIYRFYKLAGKRRHSTANKKESVLQSHAFKEDSTKKNEENEYRVFLTTMLLVGWTLIGWTPALVVITYKLISGNSVDPNVDIFTIFMLVSAICGDSIILLVYDRRWKSSLREMWSDIKKTLTL